MVQGGLAVQVGVVAATVAGLWVGARALVGASVRLARALGVSDLAIGLTVVAVGTSSPELVVTTDAALAGLGDVAVANVVGSNVYNLAVVLGAVSLVRIVPVERSLVHRDGVALLAATLLLGVALADQSVTRVEGAVLLVGMVAYTAYLLLDERDAASEAGATPTSDASKPGDAPSPPASADASPVAPPVAVVDPARTPSRGRDALLVVGGLALVLVSGHYLVEAASTLARAGGVSEWVIGGTVVAAGTSTPEFAVSLVAMRRGTVGVSVGNVVGSNVFNALGVLGLAAVLRPLAVGDAALETTLWLGAVTVAMVAALWSGRLLSRVEGALFVTSELLRWTLGLLRIYG